MNIQIAHNAKNPKAYDLWVNGKIYLPGQQLQLVKAVKHRLINGVKKGDYYKPDQIARIILNNVH